MYKLTSIFKLLSDRTRLRLLMMLLKRELCVCQIMEILRLSQPLVSRNLKLLENAGLVESRREGKLIFYRLKRNPTKEHSMILSMLEASLEGSSEMSRDLKNLKRCEDFQKLSGRCDMNAFRAYMRGKKQGDNV